jgi:hypothetical protein
MLASALPRWSHIMSHTTPTDWHLTTTGPLTRSDWRALLANEQTPRGTDSVGRSTIQCAQTEGYGPIFCTLDYAQHRAGTTRTAARVAIAAALAA